MRWLKGEDHPKEPGQYHCNIESENFKGKSIHKDTCWFSSGGIWLSEYSNQRVVSWLDESTQDVPDTNGGEMQYKPGDIPTDQEDRIKMDTDKYINLHYTNASVRTAVYWGCIAAARREYLLARRTAIAATQHPETPALGEVPADIKEWMDNYAESDAADDDSTLWRNGAIAMYRKIMEEMSATENPLASYWFEKARQCLVERNDFKGQLNRTNEQLANLEKNISTLTDDALKISEERDAFREGLERIFERRQGFQSGVIASELLKKYPKQ